MPRSAAHGRRGVQRSFGKMPSQKCRRFASRLASLGAKDRTPCGESMSEQPGSQYKYNLLAGKCLHPVSLVSPKKLFEIFDKAHHDHDRGSCQTDKEKDFKEARQDN